VLAAFGNPWQPRGEVRWGGISAAAREMVAGWLKADLVERFFARLSRDTRRAAFFGNELQQALRILAQGRITPAQMKGSWAGAMGNTQFMPSTYMTYGIDSDGDGRIDLWGSMPDVFASSANFLRGIGWQSTLPAQIEVRLPQGFPLERADEIRLNRPPLCKS